MLLLEDPGGEPLNSRLGRPLELIEFLRLAIAIAGALGKLHAAGLIHKKIEPANILTEAATGQVWLTGFGICLASHSPRQRQVPEPLDVIAGVAWTDPTVPAGRPRPVGSPPDPGEALRTGTGAIRRWCRSVRGEDPISRGTRCPLQNVLAPPATASCRQTFTPASTRPPLMPPELTTHSLLILKQQRVSTCLL
jgi:serine/threonine protein kinase